MGWRIFKTALQPTMKGARMEQMPMVRLSNGLLVANFSSKHSFEFSSGEVLPGCSENRARALSLDSVEVESPSACGRFTEIDLQFRLSGVVAEALDAALASEADIVLVPLPVMEAAKRQGHAALAKIRAQRAADRIRKTVCPDRFCR
jgi:hypothetical protein